MSDVERELIELRTVISICKQVGMSDAKLSIATIERITDGLEQRDKTIEWKDDEIHQLKLSLAYAEEWENECKARDKTIAELQDEVSTMTTYTAWLEQQSAIMLSALEHYAGNGGWAGKTARDTIAKVKALTVSR